MFRQWIPLIQICKDCIVAEVYIALTMVEVDSQQRDGRLRTGKVRSSGYFVTRLTRSSTTRQVSRRPTTPIQLNAFPFLSDYVMEALPQRDRPDMEHIGKFKVT